MPNSNLIGSHIFRDGGTLVSLIAQREFTPEHNRLERITYHSADYQPSETPYLDLEYGYNAVGQREFIIDHLDGEHDAYDYNYRGEITDAERYQGIDPENPASPVTEEIFGYDYDTIGNRLTYDDPSLEGMTGPGDTVVYFTNALNQYHSTSRELHDPWISFTHDDDGNLTDDETWEYVWNGANRIIEMLPASTFEVGDNRLTFEYDYIGRRVEKAVYVWDGAAWSLTTRERFVYDGWNLVLVLDALNNNSPTERYAWGLDLAEQRGMVFDGMNGGSPGEPTGGVGALLGVDVIDGEQITNYAFALDGSGNVRHVIDWENVATVADYRYDPCYGRTCVKPEM